MNRTWLIYAGIVLTVIFSSLGLVFLPDVQLLALEPHEVQPGMMRPLEPAGMIRQGRHVFIDLGCIYCHSQQVRPEGFGGDLDRGWGMRRSVARDYIYDRPHLLGTMRTGPDLANIGARQPDDNWHHQHLYDPRLTSAGSVMPPFEFLYELRSLEAGAQAPRDAVRMPEGSIPQGHALAPTDRARHLVAYLKSLDHSYALPEAPAP
jgi:cytochrome c oxidase cbb3-type subunit 2